MSSILDTFYVLFDADASKAKKGLDDTGKAAEHAEKKVLNLEHGIHHMGEKAHEQFVELIKGFGAAFALEHVAESILQAAEFSDQMGKVAESLDINIEELGAWGSAVKREGGTVQGFQDTLKTLTGSMAQMDALGHSRVEPFFRELGISMLDGQKKARPLLELLPEMSEAFAKMGKQEAFGFGRKMGLDEGTIRLLQKGRVEVEELVKRQKELGQVTKEDAEIATKFNEQIDDTEHAFASVTRGIMTAVAPALTWLFKMLENVGSYLAKHKDFVIGFFVAIAGYLAMIAIEAVIAFAPFFLGLLAVIALGAAFALLYDDITNFLNGNNSAIGQLIKKWPILGDIIKGIGAVVKWFFDTTVDLIRINIVMFEKLYAKVKDFVQNSHSLLGMLARGIGEAFTIIGKVVGAILDAIFGQIGQVVDAFKTVGSFISDSLKDTKHVLGIEDGKTAVAAADATPLSAQTSNSVSTSANHRSTNLSVGHVSVHTAATDGAGVARDFHGGLQDQLRQATDSVDDGVAG